ncbi:hypothetical protein DSO57_1022991 [Entomophthora muscae]|uniref:Uncharacterized protein n=1 Tax=Entomophthora muscae TaxID=34485 RepID=A0ACC2T2W5_9FUNG|nr:hypothetical protein DSO57_1022991 [Entomophthora muscae]
MKVSAISVLNVFSAANHVASQDIRFVNQSSQGWFDHDSPIVLGHRSYWISGETFTTYHLKKGAELITSNLPNLAAQLKKGNDYIKDRAEGFFIPKNGFMTNHFACGKEERCEMLIPSAKQAVDPAILQNQPEA